jgi:RHS repeat-associated protein
VHESEEFSSSDLVIDVSIWKSGYELKTISASFGLDNNVKDELDLNIHYTYDHADRLMEVTHEVAEPVKWEGLVGYEIDKDGGLKQAGTSSYDNTNAYSTIPIKLESDGSYGVKIETLGRFLIGLNNDPTGTSYKDMDYALYVASNGQLYAYENGGRKTNAGLAYFEIGDRVAIIKKGNQIYYTHNGEVFYPSNKPVTTDLYADVTSYNVGDRIVDAQLSTTGPQLMVSNEYNELGQLIKKNLHEDDEQFTQSVDYRYNIRGWLTRINNADLSPDGTEQPDLFGMEMGYTDNLSLTGADAQYNGNIAGIKWASKRNILDDMADPIKRSAYGYNYDALNRIRNANFFEGANYDPNQKYQLEIPADGYDMNGNIMYLNRKDENGAAMDQLRYHYTGNQLDYVSDASSNEAGFKDGNTNSDDYAYDGNGNMMQDLNKGITAITYNHLNLPHKVTFDNGDYINYLYDAAGTKLRQEVFKNGTFEKATDYVGAMIFENDELQFVQTSEGRLVPRAVEHSNDFEYQYHLKDHLGNVRSTFAVREDDYNTSFETPTNDYFDNYDEIDIVANNMAKTGGSSNRIASFGETAQRVGITKTLLVSEGDVVNASIYGKYVDLQEGNEEVNALPFITALANMLSGGILGGENPMDVSGIQDGFVPAGALAASNETGPQAYFNYILLDKSFNYVDAGFKQLTTAAADNGTGSGSHELLQFEDMTIPHDGFLMFFVSNESEELTEVYFDDLMINHHKTELIQADDYYPFGLTFNSYKKVYDKKNFMNTFQDQEYEQETGWVKFKWRNHQPELGRFFNVDPLAEDYYYNSTYAFSENKVTAHIELEGLESYSINNGENSFESAYNSFSNWLSNLVNVTFNLSQTNFSNEEEVEDFENSMQQASTINQVSKVGQNFSSGDIQPYVTISYGKEATNVIDAVNGNGSITLSPSGVLLGGGVDYSTPSALPSLSVSGGITIGNSSNTEGYFGGTTGYNGIGVETSSTYSLRQQQIGIVISTAWIWSGVYTGISKEVYSFDK